MKKSWLFVPLFVVSACGAPEESRGSAAAPWEETLKLRSHLPVCADAAAGDARCHSHVIVDDDGNPLATSGPSSGYGPSDLRAAYALPAGAGIGQTIALVDAYDNPNAEADLAVYRAQYGLPACTTANGCFRKVNESGQQSGYPTANASWGQEIDLDIQMASAICPDCRILLVEARSTSLTDLGSAVNTAVSLGATVISNSYGGSESKSETTTISQYYNHPGVAITVSAGDAGYGPEFPAASNTVTAVGGTSLSHANNGRGFSETAWVDTGSGCSAYVAKPSWQHDAGCARRTIADVSAVADPNTGVAVYDSYGGRGQTGWLVFGGTSVASPIIAGVYALAGNAASVDYAAAPYAAAAAALYDVTSGTNGRCASGTGAYLCTARAGYDGPTGLGTPDGVTAF